MILAVLAVLALLASAPPALEPLALPGGEGGIGLDDLRFSPELRRLLVPAGRTGRLDLVDPVALAVEPIPGFSASSRAGRGHGDGTTSADAGGGLVFASDRGRRTLEVIDPAARRIVASAPLGGGPDYVRWVAPLREVWVTEPRREVIEVFRLEEGSPPRLSPAGTIRVPDGPESLVVDPARGRAYANTWHGSTVAVDLASHAVAERWPNGCEGARGIALDGPRGLLFVGCEEGKAVALDAARGGRVLATAPAGRGVDIVAYAPGLSHLYVPGAGSATLTVLGVGAGGELRPLGAVPTAPGAHCAAADDLGKVYVCDPEGGRLLVLRDPWPPSR